VGKQRQWYRRICRIARLPLEIRDQINVRLSEGWKLATLADWLFEQRVKADVPDLNLKAGDPCSLAWTRGAKTESMARLLCRVHLSRWLKSGYTDWEKKETESDIRIRVVERSEQLSQEASTKAKPGAIEGGNLIVRSLLMDAIDKVCGEKGDPEDIARLASAWARTSQAGTEIEKLKLRTRSSIEAGLQALYEEMKDNPAAVAQFQKLRELLQHAETPAK